MFMTGLEIDLSQLLTSQRHQQVKERFLFNPMVMAIIIFLPTFAISFAVAHGLIRLEFTPNIFLLALIICTASKMILVQIDR